MKIKKRAVFSVWTTPGFLFGEIVSDIVGRQPDMLHQLWMGDGVWLRLLVLVLSCSEAKYEAHCLFLRRGLAFKWNVVPSSKNWEPGIFCVRRSSMWELSSAAVCTPKALILADGDHKDVGRIRGKRRGKKNRKRMRFDKKAAHKKIHISQFSNQKANLSPWNSNSR